MDDLKNTPAAASSRDYEALVQFSGELLGVVDLHGRLEVQNRAWERTFGPVRAEPEPANFFATIHPDDRERMLEAVFRAGRGEAIPPFEVRCRDRDGGQRRISWRLTSSDGGKRCLLSGREAAPSTETDPEDDRRLTELGLLAAVVAHDFNNVLTIIRGSASMLESPGLTPAQRIELECLTGGVRHGSELVQQVLAYSRKRAAPAGDTDLNEAVDALGWMLLPLGRDHIGLDLVLEPELGHAKVEKVLVEQVLFNLVLNARDAMPGGGRLSIETSNAPSDASCIPPLPPLTAGYVRLLVSDTGAGIAPDVQARLFEPFFTTKRNGTGLGLFSVQRIVKQCGGQLRIRSVPRQGTSFEAYFPRTDAPAAAPPL